MGVLADQMRATLAEIKEIDDRLQRKTEVMVQDALATLEELRKSYEAAGDPKAEAIQLLREEGWILTPPRK